MRIRKKRHLKERLEQVKELVIVPDRDIPNVLEAVKHKAYFDYENIFGNNNPIELEIGCGKGGFIIEKAKANPNINYLAVELLENIIVMAAERAKKEGVTNLRFVNSGADYLPRYIKSESISNIYLNFSPPFPQDGYENRRLTNPRLVLNYRDYLINGGSIFQKTDDEGLFKYSYDKFLEGGFTVFDNTEKLALGKIENVQTEYEKKFTDLGMKIYALVATKSN